eukprot:2678332-Lingulodinium_polyedra.AAC.1
MYELMFVWHVVPLWRPARVPDSGDVDEASLRLFAAGGQEPPCSMWSQRVLSGADSVEGFGRGIASSTVLNAEPPCSMWSRRVLSGADRAEGFWPGGCSHRAPLGADRAEGFGREIAGSIVLDAESP